MANQKSTKSTDNPVLTRRQAGVINRGNRRLSGNINVLMDELNTMTYGVQKTDKTNQLLDEFNKLLRTEVETITKTTDGDTTNFITKLFSETNKRIATDMKDLEDFFSTNEEQLESFINEQYKNRLLKQADLHEVASQLAELQEAIIITRDAIISADIVDGHMSRTLTIDNDDMEEDQDDYLPIIEKMEKKFKLQEKIKNFIIPRSLEYGEYFVYVIPYSKLFEDFAKEKSSLSGKQYSAYAESSSIEGHTLYEFVNGRGKGAYNKLASSITESVTSSPYFDDVRDPTNTKPVNKQVNEELKVCMEHISINNNPVPIPILEEGVSSMRQLFTVKGPEIIMEKDTKASEFTFKNVMKNIDTGIKGFTNNSTKGVHGVKHGGKSRDTDFSNIKDCYVKLMDPMHLFPIELMDEVIGYYYIQEEDVTPMAGLLTSTMYYNKFDGGDYHNDILMTLAETIVDAFDKKFLEKNEKFKKLIVEALSFYKLNNKRLKFQFIPKEYIIPFKINEDENGHGVSILDNSLFYAKLYLMLLLFKMFAIIQNSNDTKVNYIRQSGIEKNVINKIQEIARKKQQRQLNIPDMFTYTTMINKIGQGSEMYVPVGKSNERGIETEILQGQDVQLNSDLLEMLKKAYITGTGVPDVLMNYFNEADFAKTLELANNRFQGRVVSFQLDYNTQITRLYQQIAKYSTTMPEPVVNSLEFNFVQPKSSNSNITNELLNNHNTLSEFLIQLLNTEGSDVPPAILKFKKALAKDRLPMLDWEGLEKIWKSAQIEGTEEELDPDKGGNGDDGM